MNTVTIAEIGRTPGAVLASRTPSIVTNNGKPQNLILNVSDLDIDEVVDMARGIQARAALSSLRRAARRLEDISPDDIDSEIAQVRSAR